MMDDPSALRRKAAQLFETAASSTTPRQAEKLYELGRQLEIWADDLEEMPTRRSRGTEPREEAGAARSED
jgi:hypothetical protein